MRDPAVRATALSRVIALGGAPITLWMVATQLPPSSQGVYFVLLNLVAIGTVVELGPATILVQFASHEAGRLTWTRGGDLTGGVQARSAISVILHAALRWYSWAALMLFALAGIGGAFLYSTHSGALGFWVLWLSTIGLVAFYVLLVPFLAVCEGSGALVPLGQMRAIQAAANLLALWTGLLLRNALLACWLAAVVQVSIAGVWLVATRRGLLRAPRALPSSLAGEGSDTLAGQLQVEQWRAAQLWLGLWLSAQTLVPAVLLLHGGDVAGRLGITLALALAPGVIAVAWLHSRYPALGGLVANRRLREFDTLARAAIGQAVLVFGAAALLAATLPLLILEVAPVVGARILPLPTLGALLTGSLAMVMLQAMAAWARSFRVESMRTPVVFACFAMAAGGVIGAALGGVNEAASGFGLAGVLALVPVFVVFLRQRAARLNS